jgi:hypothetical protein
MIIYAVEGKPTNRRRPLSQMSDDHCPSSASREPVAVGGHKEMDGD